MVRDADVPKPGVLGRARHLFDRIRAIGPIGLHLEIALEIVVANEMLREPARPALSFGSRLSSVEVSKGRLDLSLMLAKFWLDIMKAKRAIEFFLRATRDLPLAFEQAVLVQFEPFFNGDLA